MSRFLELIGWRRSAEAWTGWRRAVAVVCVFVIAMAIAWALNRVF